MGTVRNVGAVGDVVDDVAAGAAVDVVDVVGDVVVMAVGADGVVVDDMAVVAVGLGRTEVKKKEEDE